MRTCGGGGSGTIYRSPDYTKFYATSGKGGTATSYSGGSGGGCAGSYANNHTRREWIRCSVVKEEVRQLIR